MSSEEIPSADSGDSDEENVVAPPRLALNLIDPNDRGPFVLYLHGMGKGKDAMFKEVVGSESVVAPDLGGWKIMATFTAMYIFMMIILLLFVVFSFIALDLPAAVPILLLSVALGFFLYIGGSRAVTYLMVWRGLRIAERAVREVAPNVIVAHGFGAVVALRLANPKLPMVRQSFPSIVVTCAATFRFCWHLPKIPTVVLCTHKTSRQ
eukprot:Selendium_serpulae@DN4179_c0_g1_i1.p1